MSMFIDLPISVPIHYFIKQKKNFLTLSVGAFLKMSSVYKDLDMPFYKNFFEFLYENSFKKLSDI